MTGLLRRLLSRNRPEGPRCSAVVAAAGNSSRMGGEDKLLLPIGEQPVLVRTLRTLDECPYITEIIVVTRSDLIVPVGQLCKDCAFSR